MTVRKSKYKITIIEGSVRPDNYTSKAISIAVDEIKKHRQFSYEIIDPRRLQLPLPGQKDSSSQAKSLQNKVRQAEGIILATPEYHGSYSSVIKLIIDNLGYPSVLAGKPIALLGVASGKIGAIKALEHLRSVCAHVGGMVLPGIVSIAQVEKLFDDHGRCLDRVIEQRIRRMSDELVRYIQRHRCPEKTWEEVTREAE